MTGWIDVAGWTLLHFVWQGSLIALLAALTLRLLLTCRPQIRYVVACAALGVMLAAPVGTALVLTGTPDVRIAESVHVLRSPQGSVIGVAFTSPAPALGSRSRGATPWVTEFKLPAPVNTAGLFTALVALWMAGVQETFFVVQQLPRGAVVERFHPSRSQVHLDAVLQLWQRLALKIIVGQERHLARFLVEFH